MFLKAKTAGKFVCSFLIFSRNLVIIIVTKFQISGGKMIILLGKKKEKSKNEICEILKSFGAAIYSDCEINTENSNFSVIIFSKNAKISVKKAMVIFCGDARKFENQHFPRSVIGVCEEKNLSALECFKNSFISVASCGINNKNTVTFSSLEKNNIHLSLQRSFYNFYGKAVEPQEIKINFKKDYLPYSIMASVLALLYEEIKP